MKKYCLFKSEVRVFGLHTLYRIQALIDIPRHGVKAGDFGGFIEKEGHLSHDDDAWVGENASVYDNSYVSREALVSGDSIIQQSSIRGDVVVRGEANIQDSTIAGVNCTIQGTANIKDVNIRLQDAVIEGETIMMNVLARTIVKDFGLNGKASIVGGDVHMLIGGNDILIEGNARIENAKHILGDNITIKDEAVLTEGAGIKGNDVCLSDYAFVKGNIKISDKVSVSEFARLYSSKEICNPILSCESFYGDVNVDVCRLQ